MEPPGRAPLGCAQLTPVAGLPGELGLGRRPGGSDRRRGSWPLEVFEDPAHDEPVGDPRDQPARAAAVGAKSGRRRRRRGAEARPNGACEFWLGSRARRGSRVSASPSPSTHRCVPANRGANRLACAARARSGHDLVTPLRRRREHAVEGQEVRARPRHERGESLEEGQRLEDDRGGAVAPRAPQAIDHAPVAIDREPLAGDGGAGDVTTQPFESGAVMAFDRDLGVQGEAFEVAAQLAGERQRPTVALTTTPRQRLAAGGSERDAPLDRGGAHEREQGFVGRGR